MTIGRGASGNVDNRFESVHRTVDLPLAEQPKTMTQFFDDQSISVVSENNSPDLPFRFSINPYRGCEHGCSYCYARPTHETLGMSAGLDFETKILVKHNVVDRLRQHLAKPRYVCYPLMLSGVTDPYQPAEGRLRLTRGVIELLMQCHHPVSIITKNALVERDVDLLSAMAEQGLSHVALSITTLDAGLARDMEPRTSSPAARLRAVRTLADASVPVRVMTAPIIAGLNDHEIPELLAAAADAGATSANYSVLRLPGAVEPVFFEWLSRVRPEAESRVRAGIARLRSGATNDSRFGHRMRGHRHRRGDDFDAVQNVRSQTWPAGRLGAAADRPVRAASGPAGAVVFVLGWRTVPRLSESCSPARTTRRVVERIRAPNDSESRGTEESFPCRPAT